MKQAKEEELSPDTKGEVDKKEEVEVKPEAVQQDGEPDVKISDAFLGLENKEPSYKKQDTGAAEDLDKEDKDKEEDDDFERDEDEGEVANVMEEDDDLKKNTNAIITKENNTVKVNVNINVSSINATKKSMADVNAKSKAELEKDKQAQSYLLLDTLFSYIGTTEEA